MNVPADHPDANRPAAPLMRACIVALEARGAHVEVAVGSENLTRTMQSGQVEVRAEGLKNLLHEFVHALLAGKLDDDHGIDYGAIPFDLGTPCGRAVLWDELACCVVSCAYLPDREHVDPWFAEQVEIQPVFYGMDGDGDGFWARVEDLLTAHGAEAAAVVARAYALTQAALASAGALAGPPRRPSLADLVARRRRSAA